MFNGPMMMMVNQAINDDLVTKLMSDIYKYAQKQEGTHGAPLTWAAEIVDGDICIRLFKRLEAGLELVETTYASQLKATHVKALLNG